MSFTLVVRDAAVEEAATIHDWYEAQRPGLGLRFLLALDELYALIEVNPYAFQVRKDDFRHAFVNGFPRYRVSYGLEGDTITVYQVRHTSRRPSKRYGP
ncbi:MAG: type II toxin-antitoxin system RelE/ParE family toxin [Flavobacteriales bacterium]|jgi:hypothetical protein|nr:type II toxin-antitoxin system RelE/ParE family toxin [Flavobacteriales bacterium]